MARYIFTMVENTRGKEGHQPHQSGMIIVILILSLHLYRPLLIELHAGHDCRIHDNGFEGFPQNRNHQSGHDG